MLQNQQLPCDHLQHSKNVEVVSRTKIAQEGAGQIIVDNKIAYVAHLIHEGVTLVDVSDPTAPKVLSKVAPPLESHSHKVQVSGNIMICNNERYKKLEPWKAGMRVYDVSDPTAPRELSFLETGGKGVHRMWFVDGQYAHITAHQEGFTDYIYCIVDMRDPSHPEIISRFWLPGMWEAGGEKRTWGSETRYRAHGPAIVKGDRAYLGWTDGGFTIIDISDIRHPKLVSWMNWCPPYGGLTHTALPFPDRGLLVVTDEAHDDNCHEPEKYAWLVDMREERNPVSIATVQVEDEGFYDKGGRFGPHNIHENRPGSMIDDQLVYIAYFSGGLRIIDIHDRYRPEEVGYFVPERPEGQVSIQTNDVFVDSDGLIYLVDRLDGTMYILRYTGPHPEKEKDLRKETLFKK